MWRENCGVHIGSAMWRSQFVLASRLPEDMAKVVIIFLLVEFWGNRAPYIFAPMKFCSYNLKLVMYLKTSQGKEIGLLYGHTLFVFSCATQLVHIHKRKYVGSKMKPQHIQ